MKRPVFYWVCLFVLGEVLGSVIPIKWIGFFAVVLLILSGGGYRLWRRNHADEKKGRLCQKRLLAVGFLFLACGILCMGWAKKKADICGMLEGREVEFLGKVTQKQSRKTGTVWIVRVSKLFAVSNGGKEEKETGVFGIQVKLLPEKDMNLQYGSLVAGTGKVKFFSQATNPGEYSEEDTERGRGIYFAIEDAGIDRISYERLPVREWLSCMRQHFCRVYDNILSEKNASLAKAMVLGDKENLDQELRALYQKNGIAHLIAISGLHIAMIGGGLYRLLRKRLGGYGIPAAAGITFIAAYGIMTGLSGATFRAVLMIIISIGAELSGRRYDMLTAMAVALLVMLVSNPFQLNQVGFLLSFGAVFGIAVIQPVWEGCFFVQSRWLEGLLVSISVQTAIAPVILYNFYEFPVYGVLLNLIVVPLMGALLPLLILGGILGSFFPGPAGVIMIPVRGIFALYEMVCNISERLPFHTLCVGRPSRWWIIAYYTGLFLFLAGMYRIRAVRKSIKEDGKQDMRRYERNRGILIAVFFLFVTALFLSFSLPGKLEITILDVGQGDGIYIRTPKKSHILIDGGSSSRSRVGTYVLSNALKFYGGDKLDYVFVSHSDSDHYNGIAEILEKGEPVIGNLVLPDIANPDKAYLELVSQALERQCRIYYMKCKDMLELDGVSFQCLHPEKISYEDKNTGSLVLELSYGSFDMLFTGDLDAEGEREVQKKLPTRQIEILKVGHHGSATSTSLDFLSRLRPQAACISVGERNRYGHPAPEVMRRLSGVADKIYLTKDDGAITIETDGKTYRFSTFKQFPD